MEIGLLFSSVQCCSRNPQFRGNWSGTEKQQAMSEVRVLGGTEEFFQKTFLYSLGDLCGASCSPGPWNTKDEVQPLT